MEPPLLPEKTATFACPPVVLDLRNLPIGFSGMTRVVRWLAGTGFLSLFAAMPVSAQPDRIAGTINQNRAITLKGNAHPRAQLPQEDLGPAEPSLQLGYVSMLFKPSPDQQSALDRLLVEQRDPSSPNYHKWLQPEE